MIEYYRDDVDKDLGRKWNTKCRMTLDDWSNVLDSLPKRVSTRARKTDGIRRFIEAVLWVADTRAGWTELPDEYGSWRGSYVRFVRWARIGLWDEVVFAISNTEVRVALSQLVAQYLAERTARDFVASLEQATQE